LRLQIQREENYRMAMPEKKDFFNAKLQEDSSEDLAKAEFYRRNDPESKL
jgi:alpha-acetolactate decarboxylase